VAIKRYIADNDNTITNAYKANLTTRGVSGNMGQSDILEVFHIYGQASSASSENCRALVQFSTNTISTDRTNSTIPTSGNVSFYLRMFNARQTQTTPKDFTLLIQAISKTWQEGLGLDMEDYSDIDESNWIYTSGTKTKASASVNFIATGPANDETIILSGASANYIFTATASFSPIWVANYFLRGSTPNDMASNFKTLIINSASADFSASVTACYDTNRCVTVYAATGGTTANSNALTSSLAGFATVTGSQTGLNALFTGGKSFTFWATEGGDYHTDNSSSFSQSFDTGFEDLEVDISPLVEQWISSSANDQDSTNMGSKSNYGVGVYLTSVDEDASVSYYTKKFFARGSQYFFKRPIIEARWDSSKADDRNDFYLSSSLVPSSSNLMNLYLYNIVRGQLTNIPAVGTGNLFVSIYSGSSPTSSTPTGSKLGLSIGGGTVAADDTNTTASFVSTGVYSCSFAYTSSAITTIFDVWHHGGGGDRAHASNIEFHTGSAITVQTYAAQDYNLDQKYVSNITNLKDTYSQQEDARFRLYVRKKNWQPNIYVKASSNIPNEIIDNAYYRITKVKDSFKVVEYGTGSLNHTKISYDASGSYFNFDMSMLDTDEVYALNFVYKINGKYVQQPEEFRFRVE
jgi:hypothetical protein